MIEEFNNYIVKYKYKSAIDKLKEIATIRYEGNYLKVVFISTTSELANKIRNWDEIESIKLDSKGSLSV